MMESLAAARSHGGVDELLLHGRSSGFVELSITKNASIEQLLLQVLAPVQQHRMKWF